MKRLLALIACFLAGLGSMVCTAQNRSASSPDNQVNWSFSIQADRTFPSHITAENICSQRHRFEIAGWPLFLRPAGDSSADIDSHAQHDFPVKFDSIGLLPGLYEGTVTIQCVGCKAENCTPDHQSIRVHLRVQGQLPRPESFVPNRIMALVASDSPAGVETLAKKLSASHGLTIVEVTPLDSLKAALIVFSLVPGSDVLAKTAELFAEVQVAQPDYLYHTEAGAEEESSSLAQLQYGPKLIHADRLHGSLTGKGVRVAIIDTGVDASHPALQGRIAEQYDATAKGFTPDIHGTLLAGIVASQPEVPNAISGIASGVEILAIKACQPEIPAAIQAQCQSLALAKGIDFAIRKKAQLINLSIGGAGEILLKRLIEEAVHRGIAVVASAGNGGPDARPSFPAALPNVIAVTAVDANEHLYAQATQGDFISLAAPGVEIVSTSPGNKLLVSSGTSFAAAFVTGAAALALEQEPQLSPGALQSLLERTAKHLGAAGKGPQFGSGLLDACNTIADLKHDMNLCK